MHNPHCDVRDSNHKYSLASHEEYGWWTGTFLDGSQIFAYGWMLSFTREGKLLSIDLSRGNEIWTPADDPTFRNQNFLRSTIHVERFSIPQIPAYIQDLPDTCGEFLENPSRFSSEERDQFPSVIDEWISEGQFVLGLPGNDFYLASDGSVETS